MLPRSWWEPRRDSLARRARVARLGVRRAIGWSGMRLRGIRADEERRVQLADEYALSSMEDVVAELGDMKGVLMKMGQLASVVVGDLPPQAQAVLDSLQADVKPMSSTLAEGVVRDELGMAVRDAFAEWDPVPVAAASIGQVHRARLADGTDVAVKVQYPGAASAIRHDLSNAEGLYRIAAATLARGLDPKAVVDELRERMEEELDYRIEGANQRRFADRFRGHPFIAVPEVVGSHSGEKVLTSTWVEGASWAELLEAPEATRQHAAEVIFRFAQAGLFRYRDLHGDPHPGNYRFGADGKVTFLDFGMVKQWGPDELDPLLPIIRPLFDEDAEATTQAMVEAGFLDADHGLDPEVVFASVAAPYVPYLSDEFTFTPSFTSEAMATLADGGGPGGRVVRSLDLPPSFLVVNRVLWSVSGLLGRLGATNRWRSILDEYRLGAEAATELGRREAVWLADRG